LQAEIKWKRSKNLAETHFRFISSSVFLEGFYRGIVSRIGRHQSENFHQGFRAYKDQCHIGAPVLRNRECRGGLAAASTGLLKQKKENQKSRLRVKMGGAFQGSLWIFGSSLGPTPCIPNFG
jgi:hypothetical protein